MSEKPNFSKLQFVRAFGMVRRVIYDEVNVFWLNRVTPRNVETISSLKKVLNQKPEFLTFAKCRFSSFRYIFFWITYFKTENELKMFLWNLSLLTYKEPGTSLKQNKFSQTVWETKLLEITVCEGFWNGQTNDLRPIKRVSVQQSDPPQRWNHLIPLKMA